jgi:arylsulfatase A-like enzyme
MFSGRNPTALQWSSGVFPSASNEGFQLPRAFSSRGYLTALAINSWVKDRLPGIQYGFLHVLVSPPEVNWRSGDTLLSNVFHAVNEAQRVAKPFFIVAHVDDVHHPYTAAEGRTIPATSGLSELARYDAGIALFDQGLRITIEHLKRIGAWDRTLLVVNADHGEEFGEHGGTVHSRTCYSEVTHVPLLVRIPRAEARRISQPVALIDLAPTLLELLDARSSSVPLDGQSLFVPVHEPAAVDAERPIFCAIYQAMAGNPPQFTQSIRRGRWSFFQEAKTGRVELYDQIADPRERVNLADAPERARDVKELEKLLSSMPAGNLFRVVEGLE